MTALSGLRVVELGENLSAAYCTKLLADLGADVVKVEAKDGDVIRSVGPFPPHADLGSRDWSGTQLYLDANKTGVVGDIGSEHGRVVVEELLAAADVVVTNLDPSLLIASGLDKTSVRGRHPGIVYASIRPFGSWGPYSEWNAYGLNAEATGGGCTIGDPGRVPLGHPWNQTDIQGGVHAAVAILAALHRRTGEGIDISEADIWAYHINGGAVNSWVFHGRARRRNGRRTPNPYPSGAFECKDGMVTENAIRGGEWRRFLMVLGDGDLPEWSKDPKYANRRLNSIEYADELDERQRPWLMEHTREEIFRIARESRLPFAPVYRIDEVVNHEHLNTRDFFVDLPTPDGKTVRSPGAPYTLSGTPWRITKGAPRLSDLHSSSPWSSSDRSRPKSSHVAENLPLFGVRVLDMSAVIAGPQSSRTLADMGAEVIKIESRAHPDAMRTSEHNVDGDPEHDPMFHFMNRNKRGITLNLRSLEGRAIFKRLVQTADILVENFAPRVMPDLGLDYRTLSQVNPKLIMISMPGAGDTGPLRDMLSYASTMNAVSGFDSLAGYPGEEPMTVAGAYCDWNSAAHACVAALAALYSRESTGVGQYVNVSQWQTAVDSIGPAVLQYTLGGPVPEPQGNRSIYFAPHGIFPARDDDRWVAIVCGDEEEWGSLRRAMGEPSWSKRPEFADRQARIDNVGELEELLGGWTKKFERDDLVKLLQDHGVAASPVLELGERWSDHHFAARQGFIEVDHPTMGMIILGGAPWKFDEYPVSVASLGPRIGQDNNEVYGTWLGYSDREIKDLEETRVIY